MIRKILVPVRGDGKGDNVYAHAAAIAKTAKAHVEVAHCRPKPEDLLPFGIPFPALLKDQLIAQAKTLGDQEENAIRAEFENLSDEFGLEILPKQTSKGPSASWTEAEGKQIEVIKSRGRLADLIAVAQPDRDQNIGTNSLKAALFQTGRPVMMCPETKTVPTDLGQNITIAWNGSTEAVRCVVMTRRLIQAADKITILTVGDATPGTSGEEFQEYLGFREIDAELVSLPKSRSPAEALMKTTQEIGANLMLMGAYGDSHDRETVFGGNTQQVVDHAKIPVILTH